MKKFTILLVLATLFVACENESIDSAVFNEDNTNDTEETNDTDGEEVIEGNQ